MRPPQEILSLIKKKTLDRKDSYSFGIGYIYQPGPQEELVDGLWGLFPCCPAEPLPLPGVNSIEWTSLWGVGLGLSPVKTKNYFVISSYFYYLNKCSPVGNMNELIASSIH